MKIIAAVFITITFIASCTPKAIPLKGTYVKEPYQVTTSSSFQTVWDKLIDIFAQKGIGIKIIDKSSGLIVAQNTSVPVTYEDAKGKLVDPSAWIVSSKIYEPGARKYYYPTSASAEWNVIVKDLSNGTTMLNVNITAINASTAVTQVGPIIALPTVSIMNTHAVSTGVFEKLLIDLIK